MGLFDRVTGKALTVHACGIDMAAGRLTRIPNRDEPCPTHGGIGCADTYLSMTLLARYSVRDFWHQRRRARRRKAGA
ncbi:hypothetical protein [Polymorphospora lycopeni]|uniref:Uncharacterized protein n=1 Tax=Polymorphospora lycopeni TaxID=3140240 RepID=A0ABV5CKR2_9ACTN